MDPAQSLWSQMIRTIVEGHSVHHHYARVLCRVLLHNPIERNIPLLFAELSLHPETLLLVYLHLSEFEALPLSHAWIADLPDVREDPPTPHDCPVCEVESVDPRKRLPCGHRFHEACLVKWCQNYSFCPDCFEAIRPEHDPERILSRGEILMTFHLFLDILYPDLMEAYEDFQASPQPVPERVLNDLPVVEMNAEQLARSEECTVCVTAFQLAEKVVRLPCEHLYHRDCLLPWFSKTSTCPTCRHPLC